MFFLLLIIFMYRMDNVYEVMYFVKQMPKREGRIKRIRSNPNM